jgi:hypothetical protein
MRFVPVVLYGSLVLEALLKEKLITKDHYDHMQERFNELSNPINYVLIDLDEVTLNLEEVDCFMIMNYIRTQENITDHEFSFHIKIAI